MQVIGVMGTGLELKCIALEEVTRVDGEHKVLIGRDDEDEINEDLNGGQLVLSEFKFKEVEDNVNGTEPKLISVLEVLVEV